ncbi:flagellar biosynthetic protein FliO [Aminobacter niigataensis]
MLWTFAALVLLVIVLVIVKLIRSLTFGTFVAGGRNRKTRLAVMDATAVDSQRRLVLVRRDDIEHLLLIGGPTDVVIETDIRMTAPRRPALTGTEAGQQAAQPARQAAAQPTVQRPAQAPAARPQQPTPPVPVKQAPPRLPLSPTAPAAPSPAPRPAIPAGYAPPVRSSPAPAVAPMRGEEIDETLMKELEVSLDDKPQAKPAKAADPSLDDEMAKLLGELTSHKR